jgi:hypothetical protein
MAKTLIPYNCDWCGKEFIWTRGWGHLKQCKTHYCETCKANNNQYIKHGLSRVGQKTTEYAMWESASKRARELNLPFDIEPADIVIPEVCPVLGIPLYTSKREKGMVMDHSPTLDKIVPEKGYVKDNVLVVSHKANSMKRDATIEEMIKLVNFYKQYL